ncbi:helix-turn-helix domain-containing protein [uncultured Eubacterium sp.]|uniref:helix-turn-helix domain-containing protein n=1 Tax=uncultured Eubacterium sp. TaxID=165185 RepID=UPI00260C8530|nr:helix-turn-helix transcriptional regulator [uncultured Eubacterium sp.]
MGKIKYCTNNNIRDKIGNNIVELRKLKGMKQSELVAKLNLIGCTVDRYAVSSIENNHSFDINLIADIKDVLNCSWDELLK